MEFEWDDEKAEENLAKHGVSFPQATFAFLDRFAVEFLDDSEEYGEHRFALIGWTEEQLLTVVFTEREERIRIISARRATRYEQEYYISQKTF